MSARTFFHRSDRPGHDATAAPLLERARHAALALAEPLFDSERPTWDRVAPLLLLAMLSTIPLIAVTSGANVLLGVWLAISYLLAGYLWIDLAVERADQSYQWRAFVVAGGGLGLVSLLLPSPAGAVLAAVVGLGAVAAVVAGIRLHAPAQLVPWYLLTASLALAEAGHLGAVVWKLRSDTIPAAASLVSLVGVGLLPVALWLLLHRRTRGSSLTSLLDTAIVATGLALLAWVSLFAPRIAEPASERPAQAVLLAWPFVGLVMLVVAVRFLLARWPDLNISRQFTGAALVLLIAAIAASTWIASEQIEPDGHPSLSILWLLALIGFGTAALHPSMVKLAHPIHEQPADLDWQRALLLTAGMLLAPVALVAQSSREDRLTIEMIAGGTTLLALLFAARTISIQRARIATRRNDRLLRLAATDLVVTHGRDAIIQTAIDAARALGGTNVSTSLYIADGAPGEYICLHGPDISVSRIVRERDLPRANRRALAAGASVWLTQEEINAVRVVLGLDDDIAAVSIAPVSGECDLQGLLVSSGNQLTQDTARCQEMIAALLALALGRQHLEDELGYEPGRIAHRARAADGTAFTFVEVDPTDAFTDEDDADNGEQSVAHALRNAIDGDHLIARFQPRLDLVHGRITGVEMIAAWDSPLVGPIPRGALSAIAAEHGLSQPLRLALLVRACRQAAAWRLQHPTRVIHIVVPLSLAELGTPGLAEDVGIALAETDVDPGSLVLQFTAATLLEAGSNGIAELSDSTAIGVQLSITESGAAWSEIDRLLTLPIGLIEIEASLVNRIDSDDRAASIASHLIGRAHDIGACAVALGIDRREHWIALRKLNCDLGQGTLFSLPVDASELSALLDRFQQRIAAA